MNNTTIFVLYYLGIKRNVSIISRTYSKGNVTIVANKLKIITIRKRIHPNICHTVRDSNTLKAYTIRKCIIVNWTNTCGNNKFCQQLSIKI